MCDVNDAVGLVRKTDRAANVTVLSALSAVAPDRPGRVAPHTVRVLTIVSILACYGRHLAQTLEKRAAARGFTTIALERMLTRRAMRGRDPKIQDPRVPSGRDPPAQNAAEIKQTRSDVPTPEQEAATQAAAIVAGERLARGTGHLRWATARAGDAVRGQGAHAQVVRAPCTKCHCRTIHSVPNDFSFV
jgi:hypothetical protein